MEAINGGVVFSRPIFKDKEQNQNTVNYLT
jgi:hypothetical protein